MFFFKEFYYKLFDCFKFSASRFALMQVKCILYHILRSFTFEICEKTIVPMKMGRFFMMPDKGIHLKLQPRQ